MIDLNEFFANDFDEEEEAVIMTETLTRCDDEFAGMEFIFNEVIIVPDAIYKVMVLLSAFDEYECTRDDAWYEGDVKDMYFIESDGKFYKIIYEPYFSEYYRFLDGWGEKEAEEYAEKYNMRATLFSHLRFNRDRCEKRVMKITNGPLPRPGDWYKDEDEE